MFTRRATLALAAALAVCSPALAADPIRVGEINSYTRMTAFTDPYKKGWELALEQVNAAGGVRDGRPIEVLWRDDAASPGDAVKIAEELISRENVTLLFGTFLSNIGLAVSDVAKQRQVLFIAAEPLADAVTWSSGNRYTYRLRPNTTMQAAMLAEEAAKLGAKRWATVAPNYAYGQEAVEAFKRELGARQPDVEWVGEQWPVLFKIDAGPVVRALEAMEPDAIYNVTFGGDLAKFVREGTVRGLFEGREVVSILSGEPEYLDPLGAEAPEGWLVTGYPPEQIDTPEHNPFREAYKARWGEEPKVGSIVGYNSLLAVAAVLEKAASLETDDLLAAMEDLTIDTPVGPVRFRASDHQATMGAWVGRLAVKDGKGVMVDWRYADGADYLPSDEDAAKLRPAE
ncbi:ABC transporter substrate-binding protein [Rubrimonas sp.]|uniref:ABC transporter substrate-binding protein n=1 Tax=Rubrimonas sp. TaxID=2036015 RepID=UPI002FDED813